MRTASRCIKFVLLVVIACLAFGFVVMHLWNWLMPTIFGLRTIRFAQALGLLVLSKILFGGIHKHARGWSGRGGHGQWKKHMEERFAAMSTEERERFRAGMRDRGCYPFGGRREPDTKL